MKFSNSATNRRIFSPKTNSFSVSYTFVKSQNPGTPLSTKRSLVGTLRCDVPARKAGGKIYDDHHNPNIIESKIERYLSKVVYPLSVRWQLFSFKCSKSSGELRSVMIRNPEI
jgi:hypothetical protein